MNETRQQLETAIAHLQQGQRELAESVLESVLKQEPGNPDALHFLGLCHYMAGRLEQAITWLGKAAAVDPDNPDIQNRLGLALHADGKNDQAVKAYEKSLKLNPGSVEVRNNWGNLLSSQGHVNEAEEQYRLAIGLDPSFADAHFNFGSTVLTDGRPGEAAAHFKNAVDIFPNYADAWSGMGSACKDLGDLKNARSNYEKALELDPADVGTWFNLHGILYDDDNPEPAGECLERALAVDPNDPKINFFLGAVRARQGRDGDAGQHFQIVANAGEAESYRLESWRYIEQAGGPGTKLMGAASTVLSHGMEIVAKLMAAKQGLVLEFGVRHGTTINLIAGWTDQDVHGFDTFSGIPENWHDEQAGSYTTHGVLPEVRSNVRLHQGLFEDTLPAFLADNAGAVRFINVDCDLYSSTKTIFDHLCDRIVPGTVIVFDEYIGNPGWQEDEYKAFQEAVDSYGWTYEYLAFSLFSKQALVIIR